MTEQPVETPEPVTWVVAEHKTLESCIQYLGKQKWVAWTTPAVKIGDILQSRMGLFKVTAAEPGTEPNQWHLVAEPALPAVPA